MNKKAQVQSFLPFLFIGLIIAFIIALISIPVAHIFDETVDELKKDEAFGESDNSVYAMNKVQNLMTPALDQMIFIILFSVIIGTFIIGIFTDFHPVIIGIMIIALILLIIVAGSFVNVYDEYSNDPELSDKASEFKLTNVLFGKQLPIIILVAGAAVVIFILSKRGGVGSPV